MGISSILKINRDGEKVERYLSFSDGKTKEEKREIEASLLKPDELPKHPLRKKTKNFDLYATIFFKSREEFDLFSKHFRVTNYITQSVSDITPIMSIVDLLEKGRLKIKKNKGVKIVKRKRRGKRRNFKRGTTVGQ